MELVRVIEINQHFWSLEAVNYFVTRIRYWLKSEISVRG